MSHAYTQTQVQRLVNSKDTVGKSRLTDVRTDVFDFLTFSAANEVGIKVGNHYRRSGRQHCSSSGDDEMRAKSIMIVSRCGRAGGFCDWEPSVSDDDDDDDDDDDFAAGDGDIDYIVARHGSRMLRAFSFPPTRPPARLAAL